MRQVKRKFWFLPVIAGILCLLALFLGGWKVFSSLFPSLAPGGGQASSGRGDCTSTANSPSFGADVIIDQREVACSDLISFGGTVAINGDVRGNVVAFGGKVIVDGTVDGNINTYGGIVTLQNGSHVHGDIHLYGGRWIRESSAQLDGVVVDNTQRGDALFGGRGGFSFPFLSLVMWIALGLLLTSLLPEHVLFVRTTVATRARRSLLVGLLSALLAPALLTVLIALILPIPLAIIVALGLLAAWALGTVAVGWLIGDYLLRTLAPQQHSRPIQIIVGVTILALASSLPGIGWLITLATGLLGFGAVFLSRFGTRLYGQPRRPLPL